ncbi:hypothetical protein AR543_17915 [Paenibacillus bovis]|uniref:Uncharacterized protein n=1 Tax=Paenibacillus bovis TaxID=1616788 RepID=A0A172ZJC8_9BACL|nr:hypothetical protein AR543_17915 [Paenibacillus bovis]
MRHPHKIDRLNKQNNKGKRILIKNHKQFTKQKGGYFRYKKVGLFTCIFAKQDADLHKDLKKMHFCKKN